MVENRLASAENLLEDWMAEVELKEKTAGSKGHFHAIYTNTEDYFNE